MLTIPEMIVIGGFISGLSYYLDAIRKLLVRIVEDAQSTKAQIALIAHETENVRKLTAAIVLELQKR